MIDISTFSTQKIIALTAVGENSGGGAIGMQSVINVICNRAADPSWWGHSLRDVCLKPHQFDCWIPDTRDYVRIVNMPPDDPIYVIAYDLAGKAMSGILPDITKGSTYYYATSMPEEPYWATGHTAAVVIAGQAFYNNIA